MTTAIVETGTTNAIVKTATTIAIVTTVAAVAPTAGFTSDFGVYGARNYPKQKIQKQLIHIKMPVSGTLSSKQTIRVIVRGSMIQKLKTKFAVVGSLKQTICSSIPLKGSATKTTKTKFDVRGTKATHQVRETLKYILDLIERDKI